MSLDNRNLARGVSLVGLVLLIAVQILVARTRPAELRRVLAADPDSRSALRGSSA